MFNLEALWSVPSAAFEDAYRTSHAPKVRARPGLSWLKAILIGEGLGGSTPPSTASR